MSVGAIEYLVLSCGPNGLGTAADEMAKLVDNGSIRILDLAYVQKDEAGGIEMFDYDEADALVTFASVDGVVGGLISQEDAEYAGEALAPGTSGVVILWEDPWAKPFFRGAPSFWRGAWRPEVPDDIAVAVTAVLAAD